MCPWSRTLPLAQVKALEAETDTPRAANPGAIGKFPVRGRFPLTPDGRPPAPLDSTR
ncbi:hypothetical protein JMUB6875_44000 [Nocardia sp. JMUB6875]